MRKTIYLDGLDEPIILARRRGARAVRISLRNGDVRITAPFGVPEQVAKSFAESKLDWIKQHMKPKAVLRNGKHIGKSHMLYVEHADITRPSTKVGDVEIRARIPHQYSIESPEAQEAIQRACDKALKQEAEHLLPQRLQYLSQRHDLNYQSVSVKKLKSRWGSCDSRKHIVFNTYLMQHEWPVIDYVICHELAHTIHQNHSDDFWKLVETMQPQHKKLRAELKQKPTDIITT